MKKTTPEILSAEAIEGSILLIRGHKVMLSPHLACLYGVELRALTQAVRRNLDRFPSDFMFMLDANEVQALRSQNVILEANGRGKHSKYLPYAKKVWCGTTFRSEQIIKRHPSESISI